jgi:uncharacterized protein
VTGLPELDLDVDALEEANRPFEADLPREFLDSVLRGDPPTDFHAAGAAHLAGRTTKMGREILVQAKFSLPLRAPCKRCLEPVNLTEPVDLVRTYLPAREDQPAKEHKGEESEGSFAMDEVDQDMYQGKDLDLLPAIREQILLSLPSAPLCTEDCKGLCPTCGKNLNEGDCGCDRTVVDPRWAVLKGIQLESKKEK